MPREKKFTPGPWKTCRDGDCSCKQIWSITADHPVAKVEAGEWGDTYPAIKDGKAVIESIPYGEINEETAVANANLIAAAPELLEALEMLMDCVELAVPDVKGSKVMTVAHMAIAKSYSETDGLASKDVAPHRMICDESGVGPGYKPWQQKSSPYTCKDCHMVVDKIGIAGACIKCDPRGFDNHG